MSSITPVKPKDDTFYPDSDGRPMGETPLHVLNFRWTLEALDQFFAADPMVLVAGNMFVYYEQGNRHRHLSPDVFVVRGVSRDAVKARRRYFLWENKPIDFVLELTSESTREEDMDDKMDLYCNTIRVGEYFLFDPHAEHLDPPLQGHQLVGGQYVPIQPVGGRVPSAVLGLHLEADGEMLRLYNPATQSWLPYPPELAERVRRETEAREHAEKRAREEQEARERAEAARQAAEAARQADEAARLAAEAENERLRREIDELRRQQPPSSS